MRTQTYSFDFLKLLVGIGALLLAIGVIPFTAGWVGALIILSMCEIKMSWTKRSY